MEFKEANFRQKTRSILDTWTTYEQIGVNSDFYWFTLQATTADGMHWMTAEEANQFMKSTSIAISLEVESAEITLQHLAEK